MLKRLSRKLKIEDNVIKLDFMENYIYCDKINIIYSIIATYYILKDNNKKINLLEILNNNKILIKYDYRFQIIFNTHIF